MSSQNRLSPLLLLLQNRLSPLLLLFICLLNTLCLCPCVRLSRACLGKSNLYSIPSIGDMSLNAACDRSRYCCLLLVVAGPGVDPILNCVNATGNGPGDRQTGRQADRQTDSGRKRPTALDNDSLCTCPCVTNSRLPRQARDKSNATKIDLKSRTLFVSGAVCNRDVAQHFVLRGVQPGAALSLRDQDRCEKTSPFLLRLSMSL